jgi:hypothetical protein
LNRLNADFFDEGGLGACFSRKLSMPRPVLRSFLCAIFFKSLRIGPRLNARLFKCRGESLAAFRVAECRETRVILPDREVPILGTERKRPGYSKGGASEEGSIKIRNDSRKRTKEKPALHR